MLISRGTAAVRAIKHLSKNRAQFQQVVRNHGDITWNYRRPPPLADKKYYVFAEIIQGVMWWWVLWHLWTEPDHILGEFEYPDARKWTDEELGIPDELELCDDE